MVFGDTLGGYGWFAAPVCDVLGGANKVFGVWSTIPSLLRASLLAPAPHVSARSQSRGILLPT